MEPIANTLQLIDTAAYAVKCKDDSVQTFSRIDMYKFELKLQLTLTIIRHELQLNQELSNATCIAINQLIAFQCFEYYKYQYSALYEQFLSLGIDLQNYNLKYKNYELGGISTKGKDWVSYFKNTLIKFFN